MSFDITINQRFVFPSLAISQESEKFSDYNPSLKLDSTTCLKLNGESCTNLLERINKEPSPYRLDLSHTTLNETLIDALLHKAEIREIVFEDCTMNSDEAEDCALSGVKNKVEFIRTKILDDDDTWTLDNVGFWNIKNELYIYKPHCKEKEPISSKQQKEMGDSLIEEVEKNRQELLKKAREALLKPTPGSVIYNRWIFNNITSFKNTYSDLLKKQELEEIENAICIFHTFLSDIQVALDKCEKHQNKSNFEELHTALDGYQNHIKIGVDLLHKTDGYIEKWQKEGYF